MMSKKEESIRYYEEGIKIYEREEFKDIISKKKLLNVKNCYKEQLYWYEHPEWSHNVFRCKRAFCPICSMKNRYLKFNKLKKKALALNKKYMVLFLTLNGNNVEIETDKINEEIKNNNKDFKRLLTKPFMKKIVRKYLKVIEIKYTGYDSLPHIHIVLFVIRGMYKHYKISELRELVTKEWRKLKKFNANVCLKTIGTDEKLEKIINYLTIAKKKQLTALFNNTNALKTHLEVIDRKRLFVWSRD